MLPWFLEAGQVGIESRRRLDADSLLRMGYWKSVTRWVLKSWNSIRPPHTKVLATIHATRVLRSQES